MKRILCLFGLHDWDGCICCRCAKTRNIGHRFLPRNCNCYVCCQEVHSLGAQLGTVDSWQKIPLGKRKGSQGMIIYGYYLAPHRCLRCGEKIITKTGHWEEKT